MKYLFPLFIILIFFACEGDSPEGIIDVEVIPITTPITTGGVFDNPTVTLSWEGNEYANAYSYRLESLSYTDPIDTYTDWSNWDSLQTITLNYMDDGFYNFYIKSRFAIDLEETPIVISFEVDAITGPALRVYPLYQQVKTGESCDFYIYVEDADSLAGIELNLTYSSVLLTFNSLTQGASLSNASIFLDETSTSEGIGAIDIIAITGDFSSFSGTESLAKFTVTANQSAQVGTVTINTTSILRNSNNDEIVINGIFNGIIEIVQ